MEEEAQATEGEAKPDGEDEEMVGAEDTAGPSSAPAAKAEEEESDAGSEDLEAESSGSEDEEIDEEEAEVEGDEDMEMADDGEHAPDPSAAKQKPIGQQPQGEIMVH